VTNILILQPIHPNNPPALRKQADALLARLEGANSGMHFDICQDDSAVPVPPHPSLYMRHATVRNYMLEKYLRPHHTHVLWIDSDLIDYPADLPTLLMEACEKLARQCPKCGGQRTAELVWGNYTCLDCHTDASLTNLASTSWHILPGAIVAPFAMLADSDEPLRRLFSRERFYDIGGFIEHGKRARVVAPFFDQQGDVIELDSVGCCYLAPAALYHAGVRYAPPPTDYYVEHWSVMQAAKRRGYRIVALSNVRVTHAWLPDYGLEAKR
jgi:hypothetical protein